MLRPSYSELMEILNKENSVDSKITSRYTIVIAAAKRARQIIDGASPLTYAPSDKAVSIAVKEMSEGKIIIKMNEEPAGKSFDELNFDNSYITRAVSEPIKEQYSAAYEEDEYEEDEFEEKAFTEKVFDDEEYPKGYEADDYNDAEYEDIEFEDETYDADADAYEDDFDDEFKDEDVDE